MDVLTHWFRSKRTTVLTCTLLIIIVLGVLWKLAIAQRVIARGDLLLYFYPLRDYASQAIREGRLPLWNPFTFMGAPFLANSQVGFFYPLNIITAYLPVTSAVSLHIVIHLLIAAIGMFCLAKRGLKLINIAAFCAAMSFALGGYLGAQIEHLNQLQVLAYLPIQVLLILDTPTDLKAFMRRISVLAIIIALQITAGHTQSLYICMITLGAVLSLRWILHILSPSQTPVSAAQNPRARLALRHILTSAGLFIFAVVVAVALSAVQLLPTIELAGYSSHAGGLPYNEVGSFSWRPWVVARALLPTYGDPLFPEYIAYIGVAGLALLTLGVLIAIRSGWSVMRRSASSLVDNEQKSIQLLAFALMLVGGILALGIATPFFSLLFQYLPGFNLFRAQARWLVVFTLGAAMLVGIAVQALAHGISIQTKRHWLLVWIALSALLLAGLLLGARLSPEAEYSKLPAQPVVSAWLLSYLTVSAVLLYNQRQYVPRWASATTFAIMLLLELIAVSQFQPYSRAADAQAVHELRPSTASLLASQSQTAVNASGAQRILALSGLFFDPGDLPEQRLIYQTQLSTDELYDRVIASKQKEILTPNLSLLYRLHGVDGYDGGLLPLRNFTDFTSQFATPGEVARDKQTSDGRLRETLPTIPSNEWLKRMAVKYVITDKTNDVFIENVYYDLQVNQSFSDSLSLPLYTFESTALGVVYRADHPAPSAFTVTISFLSGNAVTVSVPISVLLKTNSQHYTVRWKDAQTPIGVAFNTTRLVQLMGMTSIDGRTGAFLTQPIQGDLNLRVVHSGDVKIYENRNQAPRIQIVAATNCSTQDGALVIDTQNATVADTSKSTVEVLTDLPEQLVIDAATDLPGWLVVRDANYPGWVARIDNRVVPIVTVDRMFRAIEILPGRHTVSFTYQPASVRGGTMVSLVGVLLWLAITLVSWLPIRRQLSVTKPLDSPQ